MLGRWYGGAGGEGAPLYYLLLFPLPHRGIIDGFWLFLVLWFLAPFRFGFGAKRSESHSDWRHQMYEARKKQIFASGKNRDDSVESMPSWGDEEARGVEVFSCVAANRLNPLDSIVVSGQNEWVVIEAMTAKRAKNQCLRRAHTFPQAALPLCESSTCGSYVPISPQPPHIHHPLRHPCATPPPYWL